MKYTIIAFDLQGTLSDSAFSDEFWMETLPLLYSKHNKLSLAQAKEELKAKFKEYGKYDYRYYSVDYWLKELNLELKFNEICKLIKSKPHFYEDSLELIKEFNKEATLMILSSTTTDFIKTELGKNKRYFNRFRNSFNYSLSNFCWCWSIILFYLSFYFITNTTKNRKFTRIYLSK